MRKVLERKGDRDERLLAQGVYLPILAGSREKDDPLRGRMRARIS
nr:MAG TPA: hypothetical protein [Caudoviricetes sp.]